MGEFRFNSSAAKPTLACEVALILDANDTGVTQGKYVGIHPYETFAGAKVKLAQTQVSGLTNSLGTIFCPIIDGYICLYWGCNAASGQMCGELQGWTVLTP